MLANETRFKASDKPVVSGDSHGAALARAELPSLHCSIVVALWSSKFRSSNLEDELVIAVLSALTG